MQEASSTGGWTCPTCGVFVTWGLPHRCPGYAYQPRVVSSPAGDALRLDRALKALAEAQQATAEQVKVFAREAEAFAYLKSIDELLRRLIAILEKQREP